MFSYTPIVTLLTYIAIQFNDITEIDEKYRNIPRKTCHPHHVLVSHLLLYQETQETNIHIEVRS